MDTSANIKITYKMAGILGIAGILGGIVLFFGDMLFYYDGASTDFIANMANASDQRIIASGICALIAAWLYTLGSGQIYYAFQPAKKWVQLSLFFTFAAIMITYGVVHGAYVAIATSAKNAVSLGMTPDSFTSLAISVNNALRYMAYVPFTLFTLLFIPTVWMKRSHYPRWIILFTPAIPFLFNGLIVSNLQGEWKTIIGGGYLNLLLMVFFISSTVALRVQHSKSDNT